MGSFVCFCNLYTIIKGYINWCNGAHFQFQYLFRVEQPECWKENVELERCMLHNLTSTLLYTANNFVKWACLAGCRVGGSCILSQTHPELAGGKGIFVSDEVPQP